MQSSTWQTHGDGFKQLVSSIPIEENEETLRGETGKTRNVHGVRLAMGELSPYNKLASRAKNQSVPERKVVACFLFHHGKDKDESL